jgi:hypothetical protein
MIMQPVKSRRGRCNDSICRTTTNATLVGFCGGDGHVLVGPGSAKVDFGEAYRGRRPILLLSQGDGKEIPPELEVGFDPHVSIAQRDESCDVLDLVRVEVLQFNLVVVKEPPEEGMRGHHKPALVEVHEGDDIAVPTIDREQRSPHLTRPPRCA